MGPRPRLSRVFLFLPKRAEAEGRCGEGNQICDQKTGDALFIKKNLDRHFLIKQTHHGVSFFSPREQITRGILETLRIVSCQPDDVAAVLTVMNKLADDTGMF